MTKQGTNDGFILQFKSSSIPKVWTENPPSTRYQTSELHRFPNAGFLTTPQTKSWQRWKRANSRPMASLSESQLELLTELRVRRFAGLKPGRISWKMLLWSWGLGLRPFLACLPVFELDHRRCASWGVSKHIDQLPATHHRLRHRYNHGPFRAPITEI